MSGGGVGQSRVLHLDGNASFRGGQRQVASLVAGLVRAGHPCAVLAADPELRARAAGAGAEVRAWRPRGDLDPRAAAAAWRMVHAWRPDVVHVHDARSHVAGWIAARFAGRPPVVVSRRVDAPVARHALSTLKYRLPVARWLCVSGAVARVLEASGIPRERLVVVPSGVGETPFVSAAEARARLDLPPEVPVIGTVAALTPEKGHDVLLGAAARVHAARPEVRFAWLGEGPGRAALVARRDALGLDHTIHMTGEVTDASRWMRAFTLLAAPSRTEGLGTAVIEALAAGVPVVASDAGGLPEVLGGCEAGRLVPVGDAEALAAALLALLDEVSAPAGRASLAAAAVARAARFGVEEMVASTRREYARATRGIPAG